MSTAIWVGVLVGAIGGIPVGPMGALALEQSLGRKSEAALGTGLGAAIGMGVWAAVAASLLETTTRLIDSYAQPLQILVSVLFLYLAISGAFRLRKETKPKDSLTEPHSGIENSNMKGGLENFTRKKSLTLFFKALSHSLLIAAFRPTTVLIVAGILSSVTGTKNDATQQIPLFAGGAFLANFSWFVLLVIIAFWARTKMTSRSLTLIRGSLLFLIAAFGVGLAVKSFY